MPARIEVPIGPTVRRPTYPDRPTPTDLPRDAGLCGAVHRGEVGHSAGGAPYSGRDTCSAAGGPDQ
eukprot:4524862-Pyramimonas_sp.AAC.1